MGSHRTFADDSGGGGGGGGGPVVTDGVTTEGTGVPGDPIAGRASTAGNPGTMSAADFSKLGVLPYPAAQLLSDADRTIVIGDQKGVYYMLAGTLLTVDRTIKIANTGAPHVGWSVAIEISGIQAHDVIITDNANAEIYRIVAGTKQVMWTYHTGGIAIMGNFYFLN